MDKIDAIRIDITAGPFDTDDNAPPMRVLPRYQQSAVLTVRGGGMYVTKDALMHQIASRIDELLDDIQSHLWRTNKR